MNAYGITVHVFDSRVTLLLIALEGTENHANGYCSRTDPACGWYLYDSQCGASPFSDFWACASLRKRTVRHHPRGLNTAGKVPLVRFPVRISICCLLRSLVLELLDVLLNGLVDAALQLRTVAEVEEDLEPDEERRQEKGLNNVVEQRRSATLELSMTDELRDPCDNVDSDGVVVGGLAVRR